MAVTEPVFRGNQLDITPAEALSVSEMSLDHARRLRTFADNTIKTATEVNALLAELTVERDALPAGTEKDALTTAIDRIQKGANEELKVFAKKWRLSWGNGPKAQDARKATLALSYSRDTNAITVDTATPGEMTLEESRWPQALFTLVDVNASGTVTAAECATYWDSLV